MRGRRWHCGTGSEDDRAAEVALECFCVGARPHEFDAQRRDAGAGSVARDGEHPGEAEISQDFGLGIVRRAASETECSILLVGFVNDLFRAGELLVAGHLAHGFAEAAGGECGQGDGIEVLRLGLGAQLKADGGVRSWLGRSLATRQRVLRWLRGCAADRKAPAAARHFEEAQADGFPTPATCRQAAGNPKVFAHATSFAFERRHIDDEAILHVGLQAAGRRLR